MKLHEDPVHLLIQANIELLTQGMELLESISDLQYSAIPEGFEPHRVGGHLRHVLEFYESFLLGKDSLVDYGARRRDQFIERSRHAALARMRALRIGLACISSGGEVEVQMEGAPVRGHSLRSTIGRELEVLESHTIHHYALMALTLRIQGLSVPAEFGMAPSTLQYERSKKVA